MSQIPESIKKKAQKDFDTIVMTMAKGEWHYWPFLQLVEFIPKGKKKATITISIPLKDNTEEIALQLAIVYEYKLVPKRLQMSTSVPKI